MDRLPQSNHHPHAFRELALPSGKLFAVWADTLLELATQDDWRVAGTFSRHAVLDDFLLILSWSGCRWLETGVTLHHLPELQLSPEDEQVFRSWLKTESTLGWFAELRKIVESAVTTLQVTAITALRRAVQNPASIHLASEVQR